MSFVSNNLQELGTDYDEENLILREDTIKHTAATMFAGIPFIFVSISQVDSSSLL